MAKRAARRDLKKETFWRRTVRRQAGSGMSVRAWCRDQGVPVARFTGGVGSWLGVTRSMRMWARPALRKVLDGKGRRCFCRFG